MRENVFFLSFSATPIFNIEFSPMWDIWRKICETYKIIQYILYDFFYYMYFKSILFCFETESFIYH